jgi:hypothetical protein
MYDTTGLHACPEASPDAIAAFSHSLQTSLTGKAGSNADVGGSLNAAAALSASLGLYRSQGLQLLRDRSFSLCIERAVGKLSDVQYVELTKLAEKDAVALIKLEMPAIVIAAGKGYATATAPQLGQAVQDAVKATAPSTTSPAAGAAPKSSTTKPAVGTPAGEQKGSH